MSYPTIGITQLAYHFPETIATLDELGNSNKLTIPSNTLEQLGFGSCRYYKSTEDTIGYIVEMARDILGQTQLQPADVGRVFWYSGLGQVTNSHASLLSQFEYPLGRICDELELTSAAGLGIGQRGCVGSFAMIDLARQLMTSNDPRPILCLMHDVLSESEPRDILYNLMSDACGALLIEPNSSGRRIGHYVEQTQPYYWDVTKKKDEVLAAYFPVAQRLIERCLKEASLYIDDIAWVVPHNVSYQSWEILANLIKMPIDRIWTKNIPQLGHTVSCDHIINILDMEQAGVIAPGDNILLFTFGFGASWSACILHY